MERIVESAPSNMGPNKGCFPRQFPASGGAPVAYIGSVNLIPFLPLPCPSSPGPSSRLRHLLRATGLPVWLALLSCLATGGARAQEAGYTFGDAARKQVQALVEAAELPAAMAASRREITVGALDARLRLAACADVQIYWPAGVRPWGRTRVGLRCTSGPKAWNVSVPVNVLVYGRAWVAATALPSGHTLAAGDLKQAEVDLGAEFSPAIAATDEPPIGRTLVRGLQPDEGVREVHLKIREWFAAGEMVQIRAVGDGFAVAGTGEAVTPGVEGRVVRVRTENGKVVTGRPVGERLVEIAL
jgi:flagellar basal body P-ring formation protein FlgA